MWLLELVVSPEALGSARRGPRAGSQLDGSAIALIAPRRPFLAQTAEMFEGAVNQPSTPSYPRVSAQLQAMLEAVLSGRRSAPAAARQARALNES
jgi:maltose-binding protein MalE